MYIIQLDHITITYAGRLIFRDLSWAIDDHARTGLVGPNGVGKSTLFKTILGEVQPDVGTVVRARGITTGYLPQDVTLTPGRTLLEEALIPPPELAQVEAQLSQIEAQLADPAVYNDSGKLTRALDRQEQVLQHYERLGGPQHASTIRDLLIRLGFAPEDFDLPAEVLSGGQKKLVVLARLAAQSPDVLLLDEPDNHLDLAGQAPPGNLPQNLCGRGGRDLA